MLPARTAEMVIHSFRAGGSYVFEQYTFPGSIFRFK